MNRLLNEYKEGKAYRYFEGGWVKEMFFHNFRDSSDRCVLKAKVTPSQAINSKCYDVWAIIEKDLLERPGREGKFCQHTAAALRACLVLVTM